MARWQRRARLVLAVFVLVVAGAVYAFMGERRHPGAAPGATPLEANVTAVTKGGEALQLKGAKQDVRVEFGTQVSYADGRTKLLDFKATIDNRAGRSFVISGKEAWIGPELSTFDARGDVRMNTSDGLTATTEHASFSEAEGILKADGPVQFQRGRMSGSGVGFTYDRQRDAFWLLDQAAIKFAAEGDAQPMDVTAGAAGYARIERYMRFERGMRMLREGQTVEAGDATVFMQADRDEPDTIELRNGSSIKGAKGTGALQDMRARDINLHYAADGRTLEQAVLSGQSVIQLVRADGSAGQELAAEAIDLSLAPDGKPTHLSGQAAVKLTIPAAGDAPGRTITAASLIGKGEAGKGLTALTFDGGTEYREAARKDGAERVARARTLQAALGSNDTIEDATFGGGFAFSEGRLRAGSGDARYQVVKGELNLMRPNGAIIPFVEDEQMRVDAATIDVTLVPRRMTATGGVSAELRAGRQTGRDDAASLLKATEPVLVRSEKFAFQQDTGKGEFTGKARVWQGETSITAETITIDDKQGDLSATGNVVTVLPIAGRKTAKGAASSTAKAGEFTFKDAERRVTYVKQAQFNGEQGNLTADRIEIVLRAKDNEVERLDAEGAAVKVVLDKREANGRTLAYHPEDERYVLVGAPARLSQECKEIAGKTVTFFRGSERLIVDSQEIDRVQTKGGTKCPEGVTKPPSP